MTNCAIIGVGQTPVAEHWETSLRELAGEAIQAALDDAGLAPNQIDALYVANTYSGTISSQAHLGALIADYAGLHGVEAFSVEAGEAAGGAALRTAVMAVASGLVNTALVVGVEKSTDMVGAARTRARSVTLDADYEAIHGATLPALAGMLMRRYMTEFGVELGAFEGFSINAHNNGKLNRYAMYRNTIKPGAFARAPMVADPVTLFDSAPDGDGAAAVVITRADRAADLVPAPVRIAGSGAATDTLALHERADLLVFEAVRLSAQRALAGAGLTLDDIHLLELHDGFTIQTVLSLEALGLAERGAGWRLAADGAIALTGRYPISTFGGLKARGNPVGATGVYQAVEAALQLRGAAGPNQVNGARAALIQCHGGLASTVITHVLTV